MGRFPSIGIVRWYNYRFSDLGFHKKVLLYVVLMNCVISILGVPAHI